MTQTIRTANGKFGVWIEADYGRGRRGRARLVEISKVTLVEFAMLDLPENSTLADMPWFDAMVKNGNGECWQVTDYDTTEYYPTYRAARDAAWSKDC